MILSEKKNPKTKPQKDPQKRLQIHTLYQKDWWWGWAILTKVDSIFQCEDFYSKQCWLITIRIVSLTLEKCHGWGWSPDCQNLLFISYLKRRWILMNLRLMCVLEEVSACGVIDHFLQHLTLQINLNCLFVWSVPHSNTWVLYWIQILVLMKYR